MKSLRCLIQIVLLVLLLPALPAPAQADEIRVAVASNFRNTGRLLAEQFKEKYSHQAVLIFGSSGKHFAQINNGAPFDVMLSADAERPQKLESTGKAVAGTRFTYAIGRISLWSSKSGLVDSQGAILRSGEFNKLAMANPRHAPYGVAAKQVLEKLQLFDSLQGKIVLGSNIEQAFQYVTRANAELGFVAQSQLAQSIWGTQGSRWDVPDSYYQPIEQQAILINDTAAARQFLEFLASPPARELINQHGYGLP